jgi:SSS family solute:Na+ symporter
MQYNTATPHLIGNHLPEGMLGLAVTGLLAAFMAGVAVNVTAFNTVVSYDLIQAYFAKDRDSAYYLRAGLLVTIGGILISVATALIAKGYSNIMNYIQTLFSIFNAPLFATFIIAMGVAPSRSVGGSAAWWPGPSPPMRPTD